MTGRRSSLAVVRNPVLALPAMQTLLSMPEPTRLALADVLSDLRTAAAANAEYSWRKSKGPMAVYWKAVSVYSFHLARALKQGTGNDE